ncbi:hypothetical protein P3S67_028664 [Capsicum chacoense]
MCCSGEVETVLKFIPSQHRVSYIDDHIDPEGWAPWDDKMYLDTLCYGEYKNNGPVADTSKMVKWKGYQCYY